MGGGASIDYEQPLSKFDAMELAGTRWNDDMAELLGAEMAKWGEDGVTLHRLRAVAPHLFAEYHSSSHDYSIGGHSPARSGSRGPSRRPSVTDGLSPLTPTLEGPSGSSLSEDDFGEDPIRFINFRDFKRCASFPRYPNCSHLATPLSKIDRSCSLVIFISHQWLSGPSEGERVPDNSNNDQFNLCVQGIEEFLAEHSSSLGDTPSNVPEGKKSPSPTASPVGSPFKPPLPNFRSNDSAISVRSAGTLDEVKPSPVLECYLWIDYSSTMQLASIKESIAHLDVIMSHCDVVFTPLLGQQAVAAKRKKSVVYGAGNISNTSATTTTTTTDANSSDSDGNNDIGINIGENTANTGGGKHLFSECLSHYGWCNPKEGYLTRAWCRLELFLGRFIPPSHSDMSPSTEKALKYRNKLKFFKPESPLYKSLLGNERLHVICHQQTGNTNEGSASRNHKNEVCCPILEVKDDEELSDEEVVVAFSGGTSLKTVEVILNYLPKPTPMHLSYYNPMKGLVAKKEDLAVISELTCRLQRAVGISVQPLSPNNTLSLAGISNSFRMSTDDGDETSDAKEDSFVESTALLLSNGDRYVGSTLNGFLHGESCVLTSSNGNKYIGGFANNVKSGQGRFELVSPLTAEAAREMLTEALTPVVGTYEGSFRDDYMWGQGVFWFPDGSVYRGSFVLNKLCGHGLLEHSTGETYEGEFKDNQRSGEGFLSYSNGDEYKGSFLHDMRHGIGTMVYQSGDRYTGAFENDKKAGEGEYTYRNGDSYKGKFKDNHRNGYGTYTHKNSGETHKGNWVNGIASGLGVYTYSSGDSFAGKWVAGKRPQVGVYTCVNGDMYDGSFENNRRHGVGRLVYHTGAVYDGGWVDGKCSDEGVLTLPSGYKYKGMFLEGRKHGVGHLTYPDGSTYEGEFVGDKRNGFGRYHSIRGNYIYEGHWTDDVKDVSGELTQLSEHGEGGSYKGELRAGKKHGQGVLRLANAEMYDGMWETDRKHGHGVYNFANGDSYVGDWVDNIRHGHGCQTYGNGDVYTDSVPDLTVCDLKGAFEHGRKCGQGEQTFKATGNKYIGEFLYGKPHGKGKMFAADGEELYSGDFEHGEETGQCRKVYPSGVYEGGIVKRKREGNGSMYHSDGSLAYNGNWRGDTKEGDGVAYYQDHSIYSGLFYRNLRHGHGCLMAQDGAVIYEGEWIDDRRGDADPMPRLTSTDNINNFYEAGGKTPSEPAFTRDRTSTV